MRAGPRRLMLLIMAMEAGKGTNEKCCRAVWVQGSSLVTSTRNRKGYPMYQMGQKEIDAVAAVIRSGQMFRYRGGEGRPG